MTLAEIIEEGERLQRLIQDAIYWREPNAAYYCISKRDEFYVEHGPRLLAVARAAVEMRNDVRAGKLYPDEIIAAFDDAAKERPCITRAKTIS
jgi:hypothetical protein